MHLPPDMRAGIEAELRGLDPRRLERATGELVARYRGERGGAGALLRSPEDIAAYAAYRLPATFAALVGALRALREQWPGPPPRSLLDAGAGPGTALWAACEVWPEIERATLLERDPGMLALGRRLAAHAAAPAIRNADWHSVDLLRPWEARPHDLVICAYVLNEIVEEARPALVERLWSTARGGLLLVEPGSRAGFAVVRDARAQVLAAGGTVLAPCPHDAACPMPPADWCHFAQRVERTRLHRQVKGGTLAYEDETFAYVALARDLAPEISGRVIRRPEILPGRVVLHLCTPQGLRTQTITRGADRAAYRAARDLTWGAALLPQDALGQKPAESQ